MKVKNMFSSILFDKNYETNDEPSLTVPDQTMTIREILTRFSRGLPIDQKIPIYNESDSDEYFPDPRYMDLAERQELSEIFREELYQIKESSKTEQNTTQQVETSEAQ